jgi:hypothetical protein
MNFIDHNSAGEQALDYIYKGLTNNEYDERQAILMLIVYLKSLLKGQTS